MNSKISDAIEAPPDTFARIMDNVRRWNPYLFLERYPGTYSTHFFWCMLHAAPRFAEKLRSCSGVLDLDDPELVPVQSADAGSTKTDSEMK